jgi:hypothetical protein
MNINESRHCHALLFIRCNMFSDKSQYGKLMHQLQVEQESYTYYIDTKKACMIRCSNALSGVLDIQDLKVSATRLSNATAFGIEHCL